MLVENVLQDVPMISAGMRFIRCAPFADTEHNPYILAYTGGAPGYHCYLVSSVTGIMWSNVETHVDNIKNLSHQEIKDLFGTPEHWEIVE